MNQARLEDLVLRRLFQAELIAEVVVSSPSRGNKHTAYSRGAGDLRQQVDKAEWLRYFRASPFARLPRLTCEFRSQGVVLRHLLLIHL